MWTSKTDFAPTDESIAAAKAYNAAERALVERLTGVRIDAQGDLPKPKPTRTYFLAGYHKAVQR